MSGIGDDGINVVVKELLGGWVGQTVSSVRAMRSMSRGVTAAIESMVARLGGWGRSGGVICACDECYEWRGYSYDRIRTDPVGGWGRSERVIRAYDESYEWRGYSYDIELV